MYFMLMMLKYNKNIPYHLPRAVLSDIGLSPLYVIFEGYAEVSYRLPVVDKYGFLQAAGIYAKARRLLSYRYAGHA
jgi:hypothetical protein